MNFNKKPRIYERSNMVARWLGQPTALKQEQATRRSKPKLSIHVAHLSDELEDLALRQLVLRSQTPAELVLRWVAVGYLRNVQIPKETENMSVQLQTLCTPLWFNDLV